MTHTDLEHLIESANPQRPLDQNHHDALLTRIDTIASGETTGQAALLRQRTRSPMVKVTAVAASIGLLAGTALAINTMLSPTPSWAKGVELDPQTAQEVLEVCRTKTVSDVEGQEQEEAVAPAETEGSVVLMAEKRGTDYALWFETPADEFGTCLVTQKTDGSFADPTSILLRDIQDVLDNQPGSFATVSTDVVHLSEDRKSAWVDDFAFGQTDPTVVRAETEFANGATNSGIVRNGLYFLLNRVEATVEGDAISVTGEELTPHRTTFYRADGSGITVTYVGHPEYTGDGFGEQVTEFD